MPESSTLNVYANPYAALDHEGRPCGAVLLDPVEHHPYGEAIVDAHTGEQRWEPRRYVGAELDTALTKITRHPAAQGRGQSAQSHLQDTVWKFSSEPQTLPLTNYYLARLRDRELIPADAETAAIANQKLVPIEKALATARKHALGLWFRARPDHTVPDWAVPDDFHDLHEAYSSNDHKAAHAKKHAAKLEAAQKAADDAKAQADAAKKAAEAAAKSEADAAKKAAAQPAPTSPATTATPPAAPTTTNSNEVK